MVMTKHRWARLMLLGSTIVIVLAADLTMPMQSTVAGGKPPPGRDRSTIVAGHLVMTLWTEPGPYFLKELLPVHVSLRNKSPRAIGYFGLPTDTPCGRALYVSTRGGSRPFYALPQLQPPSCPGSGLQRLAPGQVLTVHLLLPLTASNYVTFVAQANFAAEPTASQADVATLQRRWPSLTIWVDAHTPPHRILQLHHHGSRILVSGVNSATAHLLYQYQVVSAINLTGNFAWEPLPSGMIVDPRESGSDARWIIMVSAPGYAITTATYH